MPSRSVRQNSLPPLSRPQTVADPSDPPPPPPQTVADFEQMTPALESKLAKIELTLDEPVQFETGDKKEHQAATKKNDVSSYRINNCCWIFQTGRRKFVNCLCRMLRCL